MEVRHFKKGILLFAIISCVCLTSCSSSNYKQAEELYSNGDYSAALDIYTSLNDYEDSQEKIQSCKYHIANDFFDNAQYDDALPLYKELGEYEDCAQKLSTCEREIGMTDNADYAFLADIEESVKFRMNAATDSSLDTLVNTELVYLDKYEDATFYDSHLQELATQYVEGLHTQQEAVAYNQEGEYQVKWQQGLVLRYEVLTVLYNDYGFMSDSADFIATYVRQYDDAKALLTAYEQIEDDIETQTSASDFDFTVDYAGYDGGYYSFTLKNNTQYTYSTVFKFSFLTPDNTIFYSNDSFIENVQPGNSYIVSVYVDFTNCPDPTFYYTLNNYYTDIQFN